MKSPEVTAAAPTYSSHEEERALMVRGSILMGTSLLFFASHTLIVKQLTVVHGISPWQTLWFRFLVGVLVTLSVFGPRRELRAGRVFQRKFLLLRGVLGVIGTALFYVTIPPLGAGIATLIACSYVVISILLAAWLLQEKPSPTRLLWVALAFFGLGLLILPDAGWNPSVSLGWYGLAFAGAVVAACCIILIRSLHRSEGTPTIYWAQCFWGVILTAPVLYWTWTTPGWTALALLTLCGLLASIGQLLMTAGFRHLPVSMGAGFQMALPVLTTLGAVILLDERLLPLQWIAAAVIILGTWKAVRARSKAPGG